MSTITLVCPFHPDPLLEESLHTCFHTGLIRKVLFCCCEHPIPAIYPHENVNLYSLKSGSAWQSLVETIHSDYALFFLSRNVLIPPHSIERMIDIGEATGAGILYADYYDVNNNEITEHPLIDYQLGSIRDEFDFGHVLLISIPALRRSLQKFGNVMDVEHAGFYDLRLKISIDHPIFHIQEPLYLKYNSEREEESAEPREKHFSYVDPQNLTIQKEMEMVVTQYLKDIDAYLEPAFSPIEPSTETFPVEASVIIPVRNRVRTIATAIESAVSQKTNFSFNVIVVDNHSDDGTTPLVQNLASHYPEVVHIIPSRRDLKIGGCWNEAIFSSFCGRIAVQLDSDDMYSSPSVLQEMVDLFQTDEYAMVIGSYTLVNDSMQEIPPGLINHREWTEENGRNNALRVNGFGAPRAFLTSLLRRIVFPNISYGEDYAVALRLSREYKIGRIYENLYYCRRWEGNTDSSLSRAQQNVNDTLKDKIRTIEILARQKLNREKRQTR